MAKWNSGAYYNRTQEEDGFMWNTDEYLIIVRLNDVFAAKDDLSEQLAIYAMTDQGTALYDTLLNFALFDQINESFNMYDEKPSLVYIMEMAEQIGIKDEITDLAVLAFLHDKIEVLEELKTLAEVFATDQFDFEEITSVEAFMGILDELNLYDLRTSVEALIGRYDSFGLTDHDPRQAISDFVIGTADGSDKAYDWLIPFDMRIDWRQTQMQIMPEAEITTIEMPGVDGEIIADTVYKDRLFSIVAYSEDGMTIKEKEALKAKLVQVLDSMKHKSKKLTVQATDASFKVKYEGQANIENGPSFVKATIPFRTTPYGESIFPYELFGSGVIDNSDGDTYLRPIHKIKGPINNPTFTLGEITYRFNGPVGYAETLVIDHSTYSCYIQQDNGLKANALQFLEGEFQSIPPHGSAVLVATGDTDWQLITEWITPVLW